MIEIKANTTPEGGFDVDVKLSGNSFDIVHEMTVAIVEFIKNIKTEGFIKEGVSEKRILADMLIAAMDIIEEEKKRNGGDVI